MSRAIPTLKATTKTAAPLATIKSIEIEPPEGANLNRSMQAAMAVAVGYQGATVTFKHGAITCTVKAGEHHEQA